MTLINKVFQTIYITDRLLTDVLTKTWNELKLRNDRKCQNWGNLGNSADFRFSNFESKCTKLGILGQKVLTF